MSGPSLVHTWGSLFPPSREPWVQGHLDADVEQSGSITSSKKIKPQNLQDGWRFYSRLTEMGTVDMGLCIVILEFLIAHSIMCKSECNYFNQVTKTSIEYVTYRVIDKTLCMMANSSNSQLCSHKHGMLCPPNCLLQTELSQVSELFSLVLLTGLHILNMS